MMRARDRKRSSDSLRMDNFSQNYRTSTLDFRGQIGIILKLLIIFGIDIALPAKGNRNKRCCKMVLILYRWVMSLVVSYCLVARIYKASQFSGPLMLSFSESLGTVSSVMIRFTLLHKKSSIVKIIRSLVKFPVESSKKSHSSCIRWDKFFFYFGHGGMIFILCLSMAKAVSELTSKTSFQVYKKAFLFSADTSNQTLSYTVVDAFVWASHLLYIANLYGVPSLALLLCCSVCIKVTYVLSNFKTRVEENCHTRETEPLSMSSVVFFLKKMRSFVVETEKAISPTLFFLYGYFLCSLFYIVSLTIRGKRGLDEVKRTYVVASLITLITFYFLLTVLVARIHETVLKIRNTILQSPLKSLSTADLTALLTCAREFSRDTNITGLGVFIINRNFLLTSIGMVITYGVILAQFS